MPHSDYDIGAAFAAIENELINSMVRNLDRHRAEEDEEGILWSQWQTEQLQALEKYKKANRKKYRGKFKDINSRIEELLKMANENGNMEQEAAILEAIKNGFTGYKKASSTMQAEFFKLNDRKLEALIQATTNDMQKAEAAVLRMANDQYRKVIFNAQVYANTGAGTYEKAVDMATHDMLAAGLNCVEYANGARHTLADYADMALRTAGKRAYLQGEGTKRKEWGIHTVIMNKRGNPCPKCLPWVGKILIDDVWSGGNASDGNYPLMSAAMAAGLYHPRCRDSHTTYFPGISSAPDDKFTKKEINDIEQMNTQDSKKQYASRQSEKFARLAEYSLDEENRKNYALKEKEWRHVHFKTGGINSKEYAADQNFKNIVPYADVTDEWLKNAEPNSYLVEDLHEYTVDGVTYKIDGRHVLLDYKSKEKEVAQLIEDTFGGEIFMVPRILYPQRISTPDYLINGKKYDLKEPTGSGKNVLYGMVSKKKRQADNFIIDISDCPLSDNDVRKQVDDLFRGRRTSFISNIVLIKNNKILNVYSRK